MAKKKKKIPVAISSIVQDGTLTQAEALQALRIGAQSATESLPSALAQCQTNNQRHKVQADRDTVVLGYLNSLQKTLVHTGALFERMADDLVQESQSVRQKAAMLQNATEAINLFADLVRLAASLALAFG